MTDWTLTLTVSVSDPKALWRKARDHLKAEGCSAAYAKSIIGTGRKSDAGVCLAMLLDLSEHLDGAEIQQHEFDEIEES